MNHRESVDSQAAERYLLGEMSEFEQHQFEDHFFSCADCAEDVRLGAMLAAGSGQVFSRESQVPRREAARAGWFDWLRSPALALGSAAAILICVVAYQSIVLVPGMRRSLVPQSIDPVGLRSVSRGSEPVVPAGQGSGFFAVAPDIDASPDADVAWTMLSPAGTQVAGASAKAPAPGRPLILLIPNTSVRKGGRYVIRIAQQGRNLGDFPFIAGSK